MDLTCHLPGARSFLRNGFMGTEAPLLGNVALCLIHSCTSKPKAGLHSLAPVHGPNHSIHYYEHAYSHRFCCLLLQLKVRTESKSGCPFIAKKKQTDKSKFCTKEDELKVPFVPNSSSLQVLPPFSSHGSQ